MYNNHKFPYNYDTNNINSLNCKQYNYGSLPTHCYNDCKCCCHGYQNNYKFNNKKQFTYYLNSGSYDNKQPLDKTNNNTLYSNRYFGENNKNTFSKFDDRRPQSYFQYNSNDNGLNENPRFGVKSNEIDCNNFTFGEKSKTYDDSHLLNHTSNSRNANRQYKINASIISPANKLENNDNIKRYRYQDSNIIYRYGSKKDTNNFVHNSSNNANYGNRGFYIVSKSDGYTYKTNSNDTVDNHAFKNTKITKNHSESINYNENGDVLTNQIKRSELKRYFHYIPQRKYNYGQDLETVNNNNNHRFFERKDSNRPIQYVININSDNEKRKQTENKRII